MRTFLPLAALVFGGCASPLHLTYDHGRSFTAVTMVQADLTRSSVTSTDYQLYGKEAAEIRIRVQEESTNSESGAVTAGGE